MTDLMNKDMLDHMSQVFEVLAVAGPEEEGLLLRPCVDCGLQTGCYCDHCRAADRMPEEKWAKGQMTPLCTRCDKTWGACHFCRGLLWCVPPTKQSGLPGSERYGS